MYPRRLDTLDGVDLARTPREHAQSLLTFDSSLLKASYVPVRIFDSPRAKKETKETDPFDTGYGYR